ncbi:MAG: hypothetical protein A2020_16620 [Lentisphaerae bacterium GWF2_45_14]|nr:MAG: hypothetical protein A2020_16620 [Lentisphaerae bacterium GWF2_45_14]
MNIKSFTLALCLLTALELRSSGENLYIGDTSAETQTDTLTRGKFSSELVPYFWDDTTAPDGKKSIRVDWDRKKRFIITEPPVLWYDKWISVADTPDLKDNETYTFSFYAKASSDNYPIILRMLPSAGQFFYVAGETYDKNIKLDREWRRYSYTFVVKIKENAPRKGYSAIFNLTNSPVGKVWYDAIQIERGGTATPYQNSSLMNVGVSLNSPQWSNIYSPDDPVVATVHFNTQDNEAELQCRVVDYQGTIIKDFKQTVKGTNEIELPLDGQRLGWFKITVELSSNGRMTSSHSANYIKIAKPADIASGIQPFAGIINTGGFDYFEISKKIGAKRVQARAEWGARYHDDIETSPGNFDWSALEWRLKRGKESGMINKLLVSPFDVPDWYFNKEELAKARKRNCSLVLDADKHEHWRNFIGELTRRYGYMIDEFELGAEDNGRLGHNDYYKSLYPAEIKKNSAGNPFLVGGKPFDDLCSMVRIGADEIRKTHPGMKIGAIRPSRSSDVDDLLFAKEMLKKIGKDFNIFPLDFYFYPFDFGPLIQRRRAKSDGLIAVYNDAKKITRDLGCDQPIYMSEFGWFPDARFPDDSIYRREQAETMPKDFIVARVAGFYAFDWFIGFSGANGNFQKYSYAAMNQNLKIQSIAASYSAVTQVVENVTESKWLTPDSVTRIAVMRKHDGKGVAAAWANNGYKLTLPGKSIFELIFGSDFIVTDLMGNQIQPVNGQFSLSQAPIYIWHKDFKQLSEILANAEVEMTEFCDIRFQMVSENTGKLQFINLSNSKDFEINAEIITDKKKIQKLINLPKESVNIFDIPLSHDSVKVKVQATGNKTVIRKSFDLDILIPIAYGSKVANLIASPDSRDDIMPPDPWVPWSGTADLSTKLYSSWDENNLYIKAVVQDDLHFNKTPEAPWRGDSLQFAIDSKNDGALYLPSPAKPLGPDDLEFGLAMGDNGKSHAITTFGKNICLPDNYTITRDQKEKTTTYELRLPWKKLGVKPYKGMILGMSFVIFDDDTGDGQSYYIAIGGGIAGGKNPALYKRFVLK